MRATQHLTVGLDALFDLESDLGRFQNEGALTGLGMGLPDAIGREVARHGGQQEGKNGGADNRTYRAARLVFCECLHLWALLPRHAILPVIGIFQRANH